MTTEFNPRRMSLEDLLEKVLIHLDRGEPKVARAMVRDALNFVRGDWRETKDDDCDSQA